MRRSKVHTSNLPKNQMGWPVNIEAQAHFHIRWNSGRLDWERFDSGDEAERRAKELVRPAESHRIEQFDNTCQFCNEWLAKLRREKLAAS